MLEDIKTADVVSNSDPSLSCKGLLNPVLSIISCFCQVSHHRLEQIHYVDLIPNWEEGFRKVLATIDRYKVE